MTEVTQPPAEEPQDHQQPEEAGRGSGLELGGVALPTPWVQNLASMTVRNGSCHCQPGSGPGQEISLGGALFLEFSSPSSLEGLAASDLGTRGSHAVLPAPPLPVHTAPHTRRWVGPWPLLGAGSTFLLRLRHGPPLQQSCRDMHWFNTQFTFVDLMIPDAWPWGRDLIPLEIRFAHRNMEDLGTKGGVRPPGLPVNGFQGARATVTAAESWPLAALWWREGE